jgi:signal transduction histidine kinase
MKTVLVIDDDAALVGVMAEVLTVHGYAVETAGSGEEGIAKAHQVRPDLIISDIRMPGRDGRMILRELREDPELGSTQFVLMTGNVVDATARSEMARGADDFLVKPFHFDELLSCVEARVRRAAVQGKIEDRLLGSLRENLQSNLPHEFFTPLAGILGMAQLLRRQQEEMSEEDRDEMLGEIERSGWRLYRTLSNFLVLFELETGQDAPLEAFYLAPEDATMILRRRLELVLQRHAWTGEVWNEFKPPALVVEHEHFGKIVEELLDNACRYSPPRSRISVSLGGDGRFVVEDEGRGLSDAELREVAAPPSSDRLELSRRGPGLGLRVVKRLIRRYGGEMLAQPRPEGGTRLEVRFVVAEKDNAPRSTVA